MKLSNNINDSIFRGYDIRGIYGNDLTVEVSYTIGRAFGSYIKQKEKKVAIVGYDNRESSPLISRALIDGILSTGINVINIGLVTTPMYYYSWELLDIYSGIMVTASHNPKEYNGFKIAFDESGNAYGKYIEEFKDYVKRGKFLSGQGIEEYINIQDRYVNFIKKNLKFGDRRLKFVIDPGNGTTSIIVKKVIKAINNGKLDVKYICDTSDSSYPNHHPDPSVIENNFMLMEAVKKEDADLGIALDGDGDRVGIVDNKGQFIPADIYMIIMWRYLIDKVKNKCALFDIKCTRALEDEIASLGGTYLRYRTGNSYIKAKMKEDNISFAGELSGHIYFGDNLYNIDDGLYAGLKLVEALSYSNKELSELTDGIKKYYSTPEIKIKSTEKKKYEVVEKIKDYAKTKGYKVDDIDGAFIEFEDGFFLIRASQTGPDVTVRMEADTQDRLESIKKEFEKLYM